MRTLISIDESTTNTGIAIFDLDTNELLNYRLITPENPYKSKKNMTKAEKLKIKQDNMQYRVNYTIKEILTIVNNFDAEIVVIEDTYGNKDMNAYKHLSRLQGAVLGNCLMNNREFITKIPTSWRKKLGFIQNIGKQKISRDNLKQQAIDYVKAKFDIDVTTDEADSICIGLAYFKENKL